MAHLAGNQHSEAFPLHGRKEFVQDDHLVGILDEMLVCRAGWTRFP
jgi:hypothetical protein